MFRVHSPDGVLSRRVGVWWRRRRDAVITSLWPLLAGACETSTASRDRAPVLLWRHSKCHRQRTQVIEVNWRVVTNDNSNKASFYCIFALWTEETCVYLCRRRRKKTCMHCSTKCKSEKVRSGSRRFVQEIIVQSQSKTCLNLTSAAVQFRKLWSSRWSGIFKDWILKSLFLVARPSLSTFVCAFSVYNSLLQADLNLTYSNVAVLSSCVHCSSSYSRPILKLKSKMDALGWSPFLCM